MTGRSVRIALAVVTVLAMAAATPAFSGGRPTIMKGCLACHKEAPGAVRGKLGAVSEKFRTLQVSVGPLVWIVKYDDATVVKEGDRKSGPEALKALPKDKEILVSYNGTEDAPLAVTVAVKQPYKVPEDKLIELNDLSKLVASGKGYTLIDSRPPDAFAEGHIPTAKSLPYGAFAKKQATVLPADKGALLVFYCGGFT